MKILIWILEPKKLEDDASDVTLRTQNSYIKFELENQWNWVTNDKFDLEFLKVLLIWIFLL